MADIKTLVEHWSHKSRADIHELRVLPAKLIVSCCAVLPPSQVYYQPYAGNSQSLPSERQVQLTMEIQMDIEWF